MKVTNHIQFNIEESYERIEEIIDSSSTFDELEKIPNSDILTYNNGYYFNCYSIFIDVRDSSNLPNKYQKRILAKIYRAYISEIVAIFQSSQNCKEINIVGDSVWAIFEAQEKKDVLEVFHAAYASESLINNLNYKLCKKGISEIKTGIGICKGNALMIKAGFKGSGINDVVYMGHVVNQASKMCSKARKEVNSGLVIDNKTYEDLEGYHNNIDTYQSFFAQNYLGGYYHGTVIRIDMQNWLNQKKQHSPC
ncbi:MAG: hypothetical protein J7574_21485 [Flavobacterium sp.]|uniref:adenylate/guanylate cyclase domain-containing protein n=1 Tax=Flavobacterium sp. TaxID=239 RepID=UPI001B12A3D0|nr:adenylate/guanylate cyclase domain-containing protein [Flavobacterium sp.]MBO9586747.1 hypothetical protein [Flavobacterium sp.]